MIIGTLAESFFTASTIASGTSHVVRSPELLSDPFVQKIALIIFVCAIIHTFLVGQFIKFSHRFKQDSMSYKFCHILGEVEAVFGIWALILIFIMAALHGQADVFNYLEI